MLSDEIGTTADNIADVVGVPRSAKLTRRFIHDALKDIYEQGHSDGYAEGRSDGCAEGRGEGNE